MNTFGRIAVGWAACAGLLAAEGRANQQEAVLSGVYGALRLTNVAVHWMPNGIGGQTPWIAYNLTNVSNQPHQVPLTELGGQVSTWVGSRQLLIERLGPETKIPALEGRYVRDRGRYIFSGGAVQWAGQLMGTQGIPSFSSFSEALPVGGFPTGQYRVHVEYRSLQGRLLHQQTAPFAIP